MGKAIAHLVSFLTIRHWKRCRICKGKMERYHREVREVSNIGTPDESESHWHEVDFACPTCDGGL